MDVTSQNYSQIKPLIESLIQKASYFAFDLQFTGIKNEPKDRDQIYYLPYQKYRKLKTIAETYQILQFGLSIVTLDDGIKVYPFNFYLFPRNSINDKTISMSLQCMIFNDDHGFDWNTWIKKGVNYVKAKDMQNRTSDQIKHEEQGYYFTSITAIETAISKAAKGPESSVRVSKNKRLLRVLMNFFYKYRAENKLNLVIKTQIIKNEKENREEYNITVKKGDLKEAIAAESQYWMSCDGFSSIFKLIWESKKTIIGHNCLLDILYSYHAFIGNLPENYFEFKKMLVDTKLTFIDTKFVALNETGICGKETKLQNLKERIETHHKKDIILMSFEKQFSKYSLSNLILHEAGYDSYITAWVYQQLLTLVPNIQSYRNKLNLQNSFFYIDLSAFLDILNPHVRDMLKITWDASSDKQKLNSERRQKVKKIKQALSKWQKQYVLHEGYKEIFIQICGIRENVFKCLLKLKNENGGFIKIKQIRDYYEAEIGRVQFQMGKKKEDYKVNRKYPKKKESTNEKSVEESDKQKKQIEQSGEEKEHDFRKEKKQQEN